MKWERWGRKWRYRGVKSRDGKRREVGREGEEMQRRGRGLFCEQSEASMPTCCPKHGDAAGAYCNDDVTPVVPPRDVTVSCCSDAVTNQVDGLCTRCCGAPGARQVAVVTGTGRRGSWGVGYSY